MTTSTLTNAEKIRKLRWNTAFSGFNTIFALLTFFGPAYVLFLDELGFSKTQIGFLLSFMPFTGLVALFIAPAVARFGYKRTFVTFWGLRKVATAGFLLTPWVQAQFGHDVLLAYVIFLAAAFALCRAIAETGLLPWGQEYIPNTIRGRYAAVNEIISRLIGIASTALAGYVLGLSIGLDRFMLLFAIAVVFGLLGVWSASKIPGGAPIKKTDASSMSHRHLLRALRDNNLLLYIAGVGLLTIGTTPMASFLPLFAEQQVGLTDSQVVIALQIGSLVGGLVATYLVGWAADRYGSKPVLLSGLYVKILLPLIWILIPRFSDWSLTAALLISAIGGAVDIAWLIGSGRLLYTRVVPEQHRSEYMAVYYAAVGLIGGVSQVVGGGLLDLTQGLSGQFLIFTLDPFFPLFVLALVLTVVSIVIFYRVKADSPVSVSEFATLFIHGNPVLAFESMFRYHRARDERAAVVMTERMGKTKSLLTVEELLEALRDPRFNVRFEAIISIARMESDPRLVEALCQILDGTEISLSVVAAWALGRMGDAKGIEALRRGLDAPYRSIQVHCARALGTLGDTTIAPLLLERLEDETDKGLRIAYASALGSLRDSRAIPILLDVLENTTNEGARLELALALARVIGQEHLFIRLLRQFRQDRATAVYQMVMNSKRRLALPFGEQRRLDQCAHVFSLDDFASGTAHLVEIIRSFPPDQYTPEGQTILSVCANQLEASGAEHTEYLLLALHTLAVGVA
ncbi:MAG: MFS transporter [Anaerolineaceae bacterium]|nr:MFS transporter [Anaerolineaceae bacterium]